MTVSNTEHRYHLRTLNAEAFLQRALDDQRRGREPHGIAGWQRRMHYHRLFDARTDGVHRAYLLLPDSGEAICTCGLIASMDLDVALIGGHLHLA